MKEIILGLLIVAIFVAIGYFYRRNRPKFTVDYFIAKFSAIPAEKWATGVFHENGRSCALGFCGMTSFQKETREAKALGKLFGGIDKVVLTNDASLLLGKTPKDRILERLGEIKMNNN